MAGGNDSTPGPSRVKITYLGHSTLLVDVDGIRILTDPVLRDRVAHLRRQRPPIDLASLSGIDAVVISHIHQDHCDLPSLRTLGRDTPLVVPRGAGLWLAGNGFTSVEEVSTGGRLAVGSLVLEAVHAVHGGKRVPAGPTAETVGYLFEGSGSVYFAGDTALYPEMASLAGRIDIALLPVWGWGPNLRGGHMDPDEAARSLPLLRPRIAVPIHWGTFYPVGFGRVRSHLLHTPPREFADKAAIYAPGVDIRVLETGETLESTA